MSLRCWCQHCGVELPPSHVGECPNCHKTGKRCEAEATVALGISVKSSVTVINPAQSKQIEQQLTEAEVSLWRKFVEFLKQNVIVDGFEIGFPSGIKIKFRIKHI